MFFFSQTVVIFALILLSIHFDLSKTEEIPRVYEKFLHDIDGNITASKTLHHIESSYVPKKHDRRYLEDLYGREYLPCTTYRLIGNYIKMRPSNCFRTSKDTLPVCTIRYSFVQEKRERLDIIGGCNEVSVRDQSVCKKRCELTRTTTPLSPNESTVNIDCCCFDLNCNELYIPIMRNYTARVEALELIEKHNELLRQESSKDKQSEIPKTPLV